MHACLYKSVFLKSDLGLVRSSGEDVKCCWTAVLRLFSECADVAVLQRIPTMADCASCALGCFAFDDCAVGRIGVGQAHFAPHPTAQARLAHAENALRSAEAAANAAAVECVQLSSAVSTLADNEARARKSMATRNVLLRDGLRASETRARSLAEDKRRCELESKVLCRLHDDDMADRLHSVQAHHAAQLEVAHNVERVAAQLSVERVRMELAAYKEPWVYLHGKKSPTANADVARRLGLKMTALNTLHVPP
eukprot:354346-Chlamydomonas_euryale.AAC.12